VHSRSLRTINTRAICGFFCLIALACGIIAGRVSWVWFAPVAGSCFVAFGQPESRMARKRNVIGGHVCAFAVGGLTRWLVLDQGIAIVAATCITFALMLLLDCLHSPAGATPAGVCLSSSTLPEVAAVLSIGLGMTVLMQFILARATARTETP